MCLKSITALFACGVWLTIPTLIIGFGGFAGIGMGMMLVSCVAALNQHFDKKKALANSIMMCGAPLGYFLSAPVLIHLLETKGLEVTFFFQGENQFHSTVCGIANLLTITNYSDFEKPQTFFGHIFTKILNQWGIVKR